MNGCRSCGAEVTWARTLKDKANPLDLTPVDPNDRGAMVTWREGGQLRCAGIRAAADAIALVEKISVEHARMKIEAGDYPAYVSHFSTCPNAGGHRGRGNR